MKILAGLETADSGILSPKRGLVVGYVPQTCDFPDLSPKQTLINALKNEIPLYERERLAETQLNKLGFYRGKEPFCSPSIRRMEKTASTLPVELISSHRICSSSTSPPTTLIWKESSGLKNF